MDPLYAKLTDAIEKSNKSYDLERIKAAYTIARQAHEGQMRSSGDPYISHPIEVAIILVGLGMDSDTIIGGILHDVVEDTSITLEDIQKRFGGDVADLVDGVTKLANIPYSSRAEQQAENVRKMLLAMAKDVRVVIIKLADRLHNMRSLPRNRTAAGPAQGGPGSVSQQHYQADRGTSGGRACHRAD